IADDLNLPFIDRCGARDDGRAHVAAFDLQPFGGLRIALRASAQNRAVGLAWTLTVLQAGLQHIAAESTDRLVCLDAEQSRGLRIEIANHSRSIDGVDTFDDAAQNGLCLYLASAQRVSELHEIVAHVLHRARELADLFRAFDR